MRELTVYVHHAHMSAERRRSFLNYLRRFTGALNAFLYRNQIQFVGLSPVQFNDLIAQASVQASFNMGYLANSFALRTLVRRRIGGQHLRRWICLVVIILISAFCLYN